MNTTSGIGEMKFENQDFGDFFQCQLHNKKLVAIDISKQLKQNQVRVKCLDCLNAQNHSRPLGLKNLSHLLTESSKDTLETLKASRDEFQQCLNDFQGLINYIYDKTKIMFDKATQIKGSIQILISRWEQEFLKKNKEVYNESLIYKQLKILEEVKERPGEFGNTVFEKIGNYISQNINHDGGKLIERLDLSYFRQINDSIYSNLEKFVTSATFNLTQQELLENNIISQQYYDWIQQKLKANWAAKFNTIPLLIKFHKNTVCAVCISNDNQLIATCSTDQSIMVYNLKESTAIRQYFQTGCTGEVILFSPNQKYIVCPAKPPGQDLSQKIVFYDYEDRKTNNPVKYLVGHISQIYCMAFEPTSQYLFSGSEDGALKIWNFEQRWDAEYSIQRQQSILSISISKMKEYFFAYSQSGGIVQIYSFAPQIESLDNNSKVILAASFSVDSYEKSYITIQFTSDQLYLVSSSDEGLIKIWSFENTLVQYKKEKQPLPLRIIQCKIPIYRFLVSHDYTFIITSEIEGKKLKIWNFFTGNQIQELSINNGYESQSQPFLSQNGEIIIGGKDKKIKIFTLESTKQEIKQS